MTARQARFEVCRGDDGYWARFRAANGRVVWVTETYQRRRAASDAIALITEVEMDTGGYVVGAFFAGYDLEVRQVDER